MVYLRSMPWARRTRWAVLNAACLVAAASACGHGTATSPTTPTTPAAASLIGLTVTKDAGPLVVGYTAVNLHASAQYSTGQVVDVTTLAAWVSSSPQVAVISTNGVATSASNGSAIVTAAYQGLQASTTLSAIKAGNPYISGALTPYLSVGSTKDLSCWVDNGLSYDGSISSYVCPSTFWASSNQTVATVDQQGRVTAISPGDADIRVTFDGKTVVTHAWVPQSGCTYSLTTSLPQRFYDVPSTPPWLGVPITVHAPAGCEWQGNAEQSYVALLSGPDGTPVTGGSGTQTLWLQPLSDPHAFPGSRVISAKIAYNTIGFFPNFQ